MPLATSSSITPKIALPKALPRAARAKVEAAIEAHVAAQAALIAFLDEADGDPEEEPDLSDYEPSVGECSVWLQSGRVVKLLDAEGDEHDGREFQLRGNLWTRR